MTIDEVRDMVESKGFLDVLLDYVEPHEIDDPELSEAWEQALDACLRIEDILNVEEA